MSIIWWTLYILGAITVVILWINTMTLIVRVFTYIFKSEWCKVKVIQGPPGPRVIPVSVVLVGMTESRGLEGTSLSRLTSVERLIEPSSSRES